MMVIDEDDCDNDECTIDIDMTSHYVEKKELIKSIIENAKTKKKLHRASVTKYRRIGTIIKALVNVLNALSVSSLIADSPNSGMKYVALGTTSISATISAFVQALGLDSKTESHNSTYLALSDLTRDFSARLLRNHLSSEDLDTLLGELNGKISLIEDASLI
jgi:hypothetical protein